MQKKVDLFFHVHGQSGHLSSPLWILYFLEFFFEQNWHSKKQATVEKLLSLVLACFKNSEMNSFVWPLIYKLHRMVVLLLGPSFNLWWQHFCYPQRSTFWIHPLEKVQSTICFPMPSIRPLLWVHAFEHSCCPSWKILQTLATKAHPWQPKASLFGWKIKPLCWSPLAMTLIPCSLQFEGFLGFSPAVSANYSQWLYYFPVLFPLSFLDFVLT